MLAVHGEGAVENNLFLPECETGLQFVVAGRLEARAAGGMELGGCAASKDRDNAGRGGWIGDERFQNSCVGGGRILVCHVQHAASFWGRQADPKRGRLAYRKKGLLLFPFRKVYWKHNGSRGVEGFEGTPGGPNLGTALEHPCTTPLYPCHSVSPPHPVHPRYQIGIDRCAACARARARPHHHPFALPSPFAHLSTPSTPRSPPTTDPPCPTLLLPFKFVCNHIILRTHPCLYTPPEKYFPVTP